MLIKTLLNKVERFKSFVYSSICVVIIGGMEALVIDIEPRSNSRPICPVCSKRCSVYDRQPQRLFEYLPIWSFKAYFRYAPRRVNCPVHGVKVESMPWGFGKERTTFTYQIFLSRWAKRLLWCGPERRVKTLLHFFREFGKERCTKLQFVCSDMWAPYLKVIAKKAPQALNVLDRFHIMRKFNEAIDDIRCSEVKQFKANQQENILVRGRWLLLKRPQNLSEK